MYNISIVIYNDSKRDVINQLQVLTSAEHLHLLYIIDNSLTPLDNSEEITKLTPKVKYIHLNGKNVGYGTAHNIAIRESIYDNIPFHLVMNLDVKVSTDTIEQLYFFLQNNPKVGQVMPQIVDSKGQNQNLYKLLPTPLNLFVRRFLPSAISNAINKKFELRHLDNTKIINAPYLSGCFMFFKTEALFHAGLFDERFFMYAEDIDITRRIHRDYLTLFVPFANIEHAHARASYYSLKMLIIHVTNVCKYFHKWGWFFDKERKIVNKITFEQ